VDRVEDVDRHVSDGNVPPVAVIGGGYAGMAAAVRLAELGIACTVFEAAKVLGGRARRIVYRETTLDNGQHILSGAYSQLLRMMDLVGVPSSAYQRIPLTLTMRKNSGVAFELRAPKLPAPLHLAAALLRAKGITFAECRAAIRFMQSLKHAQFSVDKTLTVSRLLAQHQQPQNLIDCLWQPLTISALNTPLNAASAQVFANVLRDALASARASSDLILPKVDLTKLFPEPAEEWLLARGSRVLSGAKVTRIAHTISGVDVSTDEANETFSAAIVAVGPHQLASLGFSDTAHFTYEPIYTVYLQYPQAVTFDPAMIGRTEGLTQWFFDRETLSQSGARHTGLVAGVISASGAHEALDQAALANTVHDELVSIAGPLPTPVWHKVVAEKFATFACTPKLVRPSTTTNTTGVFLAGDYVECDYPATLEAAVRNGIAAAEAASRHLSTNSQAIV
jgi:hydroxysqualene dehydroxylase